MRLQKRKAFYILFGLIVAVVCVVTIFKSKMKQDQAEENYCRNFSYKECPSTCDVGPSCDICMDIGCHSRR